jgi:ferredoxin
MMKYIVKHFRDDCIGCGACASAAPKYWKMNEDGLSDMIGGKDDGNEVFSLGPLDIDFDINEEASISCPVNCIHIYEIVDGKEERVA